MGKWKWSRTEEDRWEPEQEESNGVLRWAVLLLPGRHGPPLLIIWPGSACSAQPASACSGWLSSSCRSSRSSSPAQLSCSGSLICSAWFGSPTRSGKFHSSASSSHPPASPGRRIVTPLSSGRLSSLCSAHCCSPEHSLSWQSFSHRRTPLVSSSSDSCRSSCVRTPADQDCSCSPVHGSLSHHTHSS